MLGITLLASVTYLALLFLLAGQVRRRPAASARFTSSAAMYALSLGVYATAWTYFGSIGLAAEQGNLFLSVYVGPALAAVLFWPVLGRIIRIARRERIHSIADFISARYGKSELVGMVVTLIAIAGITPYLAVQLKAIAAGLELLAGPSLFDFGHGLIATVVGLALGLFVLLFGTRELDLTKPSGPVVAVIGVESGVKLTAFLVVGFAITFGLFSGPGQLFSKAAEDPALKPLLAFGENANAALADWPWMVLVSALAVFCLPRMFQMAVVENERVSHVRLASWMFPLYLLGFSLFTLAIALAGRLLLPAGTSPDVYLLALPQVMESRALIVLAFLGGFSAATAMIIVETLALSNMVTNQVVIPMLMRAGGFRERTDFGSILKKLRQGTVIAGILLASVYVETLGEMASLVDIGLVSFLAIAQFAPALLLGIFWTGATRLGALFGLVCGFLVWLYTMVLPLAAQAALLEGGWMEGGPFGLQWLRPQSLFGVELPPFAHTAYWSLLLNVGLLAGVSLLRPSQAERRYAARFLHPVAILPEQSPSEPRSNPQFGLLVRVFGASQAEHELQSYESMVATAQAGHSPVFAEYVESRLAGVIGRAAASLMVGQAEVKDPLRDPVTSLPNRYALVGEVADRLATTRDPATVVIAALRIDRHRLVMTGLGETASNLLIRRAGERLLSELKESELLARTGLDTFVLVMSPSQDVSTACVRMSDFQEVIAPTFNLQGALVSSPASVGIAQGTATVDAEGLLSEAETAVEVDGGMVGNCRFFEQAMRETVLETVAFEARLHRARQRGELDIRYQPVIRLVDGGLSGFEALLRWRPEKDVEVSPTRFIPVMESTGLILDIGDFVLEQVCRRLDAWRHLPDGATAHISVNLSARQFSQAKLARQVGAHLSRYSLDPGSLWLEITETTLMQQPEMAYRTLSELRQMGVKILLDDFGTGYSSLAYLQRFPIDILKIDQTFVRRYGPRPSPLAEAVVAIAKKLDMEVVAEGVETQVQYEWLCGLGVDYGQGFYFNPPLSRFDAEALLRAQAVRSH